MCKSVQLEKGFCAKLVQREQGVADKSLKSKQLNITFSED